jgi:voltage-gated potassium channel
MDVLRRRILLFIAMLGALIAFGSTGYILFAGYPPFDALYMAVMTLTTVGYGEVRPLTTAGRVFNIFYMLLAINALFFGVGMLASTFFELRIDNYFQGRRRKNMIESLSGHFIICGFGRVGRGAALELQRSGIPIVVIDRNEARIEQVLKTGFLGLQADANRDETLREAGIERARGLIAALSSDADNLFLTISARTLNPQLHIATRANEDESVAKLRRAGATYVVSPYSVTGSRLAQAMVRPHVTQFLDYATFDPAVDMGIEQIRVSAQSQFQGKAIQELTELFSQGVMTVLAIRRGAGDMIFNPTPATLLTAGDHLIVMGPTGALQRLEQSLTSGAA